MIVAVHPRFDRAAFVTSALRDYESLDLMPRGWHLARTLRRHLPDDFEHAVQILIDSLGPPLDRTKDFGMSTFLYLPHVFFVAEFGLDHFEASMQAQYELTQRFTAEYSIRPFLMRHQTATLRRLRSWVDDPSPHVRRLVSEGTRPRLPWAPRLKNFQDDPQPVLELLELLKDDPELYVRRSVANNLNDIGKDHPTLLTDTAARWMVDATKNRQWLIGHALRSAIKRSDPDALAVLGFGKSTKILIENPTITPQQVKLGETISFAFDLRNTSPKKQHLLVDFQIHFVKANGKTNPKVFKLKSVDLAPQASITMAKRISVANLTTRKHYPGTHAVDVIVNGVAQPLGSFEILAGPSA